MREVWVEIEEVQRARRAKAIGAGDCTSRLQLCIMLAGAVDAFQCYDIHIRQFETEM